MATVEKALAVELRALTIAYNTFHVNQNIEPS
jgi:hypothetical protein